MLFRSAQHDIATISRSATRFAVLRTLTSCCVGDKVSLDVVLSPCRRRAGTTLLEGWLLYLRRRISCMVFDSIGGRLVLVEGCLGLALVVPASLQENWPVETLFWSRRDI